MKFTDLFIRRPVLATVVSLVILLVGLRSYFALNVREYPRTQDAVVTVTTVYTGADANLVRGFITTPLEQSIASADGIDYLDSVSVAGRSTISAHLRLNYNPEAALTAITSNVNAIRSQLPAAAEDPVIKIEVGRTTASMYMSFYSNTLKPNQITDYLIRVVQPKLSAVPGVESARLIGDKTFAMRIWLDPERMAALDVTADEVRDVLARNNFLAAVGSTKGPSVTIDLTADTNVQSVEEFRKLVIRRRDNATIRLGDVATVELGAENYQSAAKIGGRTAVFIGVSVLPSANVLSVIDKVRAIYNAEIKPQLPRGLESQINYDATNYVNDSINDVVRTLVEALLIVIAVIFLFLGSARAVVIPAVAVPLSLIGAGFLMLALGYSINLLTLLAMVLAIGMVVDDAIIVVENISRHIENGETPKNAALHGARELAGPVVAMTITLLAVYAPIGFVSGVIGTLFSEFAFTLAGAVLISGIIALTLSPMMCSQLLKTEDFQKRGLVHFLDRNFDRLRGAYLGALHHVIEYRWAVVGIAAAVIAGCYFLYGAARHELAPTEDRGIVLMQATGAPDASIDQMQNYTDEITHIASSIPEVKTSFLFTGFSRHGNTANSAFAGLILKPYGQRHRTQDQVKAIVQGKVAGISGLNTVAFDLPSLPGSGGGLPIQFVVGSVDPPRAIDTVSNRLLKAARASGKFAFVDSDLKFDRPQTRVVIDRDKAADLGIDMRELGSDLAGMLSGAYVNRFSLQGRSYEVIPQVERSKRITSQQLEHYHVRTASGDLVPLSTLVSLKQTVEPQALHRFQQLNAATISGVPAPGVTLGEAISFLQKQAKSIFPQGYSADYSGPSRQYVKESAALALTFAFALIVIYLVLAAQFESFRDPLIMLVSVPMSVFGALIFVALGFTTINIYTQVGLVTLIGLIAKHGILIVEFANQLQIREGLDKREAVAQAAAIRLRPILMTTASIIVATVPLLIATGAGAASRFAIGLVIFTGMAIGTAFTLFVVPVIYTFLGKTHRGDSNETSNVVGADAENVSAAEVRLADNR